MADFMKRHITRQNLYLVLLLVNLLLAVFRFELYPARAWIHIYMLAGNFFGMVLGWEILLLLHRSFVRLIPFTVGFIPRVIIQIGLLTILFTQLSKWIHLSTFEVFDYEFTQAWPIVYMMNFLMATILNLILFGSQYFFQWKSDLISKTNLEKKQAVVKYDALRNQLNPHFLFNALTSLNSLIFENQQLASEFLHQLSKVYRYTLQNSNKETVSLRTELNFLENYVSLLETRFGRAIDIRIAVNEKDLDKGIVPVVSQMLMENAIKHNQVCIDCPLNISITSGDDFFVVENNMTKKINVETSNKIGMKNLDELYKYLTDRPLQIEETQDRFTVKLPLIQ